MQSPEMCRKCEDILGLTSRQKVGSLCWDKENWFQGLLRFLLVREGPQSVPAVRASNCIPSNC